MLQSDRWLALTLVALAGAGILLMAGLYLHPPEATDKNGPRFSVPWTPSQPATPVVRFVVLGDFGMNNEEQAQVAAAMKDVCETEGCDFAHTVGDNIYYNGVSSVNDPKFKTHFEDHYGDLGFPMYVAVGDHDAEGDVQAMVDYSERSDVWTMPGRWYKHDVSNVRFVVLDHYWIHHDHKVWAKDQIENTTQDWVFAVGHVPYVSNGEYGGADHKQRDLIEDVVCDRADLYLSGDDHILEWLPAPECGRTEQVISGAGGAPRSIVDHGHGTFYQKGDTLGFAWFEVDGHQLTGRFYDSDGSLLYERIVVK